MATVWARVCVLLLLILLLLAPAAARKFGVTTDDNGTPVLEEGDVQAKDPTNIIAKKADAAFASEPPKPVLEVPTAPPGVSGPPGNGKKTPPGLTTPPEYSFIQPGDKPKQPPKPPAEHSKKSAPPPKQPAEPPEQKDPQFHLPTKKDTTVPLLTEDTAPKTKNPPLQKGEDSPSEKNDVSLPPKKSEPKEEAPAKKNDSPSPKKANPPPPLPPKKNHPPAPKKEDTEAPHPPKKNHSPAPKKEESGAPLPSKKNHPPVPKKEEHVAPPALEKNHPPVPKKEEHVAPLPAKKNHPPVPKKDDHPAPPPPKKNHPPVPRKEDHPALIRPKKNDSPAPKRKDTSLQYPLKKDPTTEKKENGPPQRKGKDNKHAPKIESNPPPKKKIVPRPTKDHSTRPPKKEFSKRPPRPVSKTEPDVHIDKPHFSEGPDVELISPHKMKSQWQPQHDYIIPKGFECVNFGPVRQAGMVQYMDSDITGHVSTYSVPHHRFPKLPTAFLSHVFGKEFSYYLHTGHKNRQRAFDLIVGFAEVYPGVCGANSAPRVFSMQVGSYSKKVNAEARVGCGRDLKIPLRNVASEDGKILFSFKALSQNAMLSLICYSPVYIDKKQTGHTYPHSNTPVTHVTSNGKNKPHEHTLKSNNKIGAGKAGIAKSSSVPEPSTAIPSEKQLPSISSSTTGNVKNTHNGSDSKTSDTVVNASPSTKNDGPTTFSNPSSGEAVDTIDTLSKQKGVKCINFGEGTVKGLSTADSSAFSGHVMNYTSTSIVKGTSLSDSFRSHVFGKKFSYTLAVPKMGTYSLAFGFAETFNLVCNSPDASFRSFKLVAGSQSKVLDVFKAAGCNTAHTEIIHGVKSQEGSAITIGFEALKNNAMLSNLCYWEDDSKVSPPIGSKEPGAKVDATPSVVIPAAGDGPVTKGDLVSVTGTKASGSQSPSTDASTIASSVSASVAPSPSASTSAKPTKKAALKGSPLPKVNAGIIEDTQGGHGSGEVTTKEDGHGHSSDMHPTDVTPFPSAKPSSSVSPVPKGSLLPKVTSGVIEDTQGGHGTETNILIPNNSSMLDIGDGGKSNEKPIISKGELGAKDGRKSDVVITIPMSVSPTPSAGTVFVGNPDPDINVPVLGTAPPTSTVVEGDPDAVISSSPTTTPASVVIVRSPVPTASASSAPLIVIAVPLASPSGSAQSGSDVVITIPSDPQGTSVSDSPSPSKVSDDVTIAISPVASPSIGASATASSDSDVVITIPILDEVPSPTKAPDVVISIDTSTDSGALPTASSSPLPAATSDDTSGGIVVPSIVSSSPLPSVSSDDTSDGIVVPSIVSSSPLPSASSEDTSGGIVVPSIVSSSPLPSATSADTSGGIVVPSIVSSSPLPSASSDDTSGGIVVPSIVSSSPLPSASSDDTSGGIVVPSIVSSSPLPSASSDDTSGGIVVPSIVSSSPLPSASSDDTSGGIVVPSIVDDNSAGKPSPSSSIADQQGHVVIIIPAVSPPTPSMGNGGIVLPSIVNGNKAPSPSTAGEPGNSESVIPFPSVGTTSSTAVISSTSPAPADQVIAIPQASSSSSGALPALPLASSSPSNTVSSGTHVGGASSGVSNEDNGVTIVLPVSTMTAVPQPAASHGNASAIVTAIPQPPANIVSNEGNTADGEGVVIAIPFSKQKAANGENPSNTSQVLIGVPDQSPGSSLKPAPKPFTVQNQVGLPILGNTSDATPSVSPSTSGSASPLASSTSSASPSASSSMSVSLTPSGSPSPSVSASMSLSVSPSATPAPPMSLTGGTTIITIDSSPLPSGASSPPRQSLGPAIIEVPDKSPTPLPKSPGVAGQTVRVTVAPTAVLLGPFAEVVGTNKETSNAFAIGMGFVGSLLVLMLVTCLYFAIFAGRRGHSNSQLSQYSYPRDDGHAGNDYGADMAPHEGFVVPTGYEDDADLRIPSGSVASDPVYQNVDNGSVASGQIYEQEADEFDPYGTAAVAAAANPESPHGSEDPYSIGVGATGHTLDDATLGYGAVGLAGEGEDSFELAQDGGPELTYDMQHGQDHSFEENHSAARPARIGLESSGNEERRTISTENDDMYSDYGNERPVHMNGKTNSQYVRDQLASIHHQIASRLGATNSQSSSGADGFTPRESQGSEGYLSGRPRTQHSGEDRHSNSTDDDNDTSELCYKSTCDDDTQGKDAMDANGNPGGNDPWPHWYNAPRAGPHASTHYQAGVRNQGAVIGGPDLLASVRDKLMAAQLPEQDDEAEQEASDSSWIARERSSSTGQPTLQNNAPENNAIFRAPTLAQRWPVNKADDENSSVAESAKYSDGFSSQSSGRPPLGPANNAFPVALMPPKPVTLQDISGRPAFNQDMLAPSSGVGKVAALFGGAETPKVELGAVGSVPVEAVDPEKNRYSQRFGQGRTSGEPVVPVDVAELRKRREPNVKEAARRLSAATHVTSSSAQSSEIR